MADFSIGEALRLTLFGQSHGPAVGCVLDGFPAGSAVDWKKVEAFMARRAPGQTPLSTPRREADLPEILSGFNADGTTCGGPIAVRIANTNVRSGDYPDLHATPRPGHADFAANSKYGAHWDDRGGGFFSARLTAPLCFAGALCAQALEARGIAVSAHIACIGGVFDDVPDAVNPTLPLYSPGDFPVINPARGDEMKAEILAAREAHDSVGGAVRCVVTGLPAGLGGPYFGGLEGRLSLALFGIPAVKGVQFGDVQPRGSLNNDPYYMENGRARAASNNAGGILGGITTGMPIIFTVSFKPTPSISLPQRTVDTRTMQDTTLTLQGRHDPCVVPRAVPVVEAAAAFTLLDVLLQSNR